MRKNTLNFVVDLLALLAMLVMIATGLLIKYVLPPREGSGPHRSLAGMDRHDWGDIHFWAAVALGVLLVLHVVLHWKWVCITVQGFLRRREEVSVAPVGTRTAYGLAFLGVIAAIVAVFLWVGSVNVEIGSAGPGHGLRRGPAATEGQHERGGGAGGQQAGDARIRGSMTLAQVAQTAGVSVEALRGELDLPADVSPDERLGRLRQDYGFDMSEVRDALRRLQEQLDSPP
jgi:hypothetical protein